MFFYNEPEVYADSVAVEGGGPTDPYFSNVSLLLNMDSDFSDSSTNNHIATTGGNVTVSTTESKYGGGSGYFDGNVNTGVSFPSSDSLDLRGVDWTMEAWINPDGNYSDARMIISKRSWDANYSYQVFLTNGTILFHNGFDGGVINNTSVSVQANVWSHLAIARHNGTITVYLNGQSLGSIVADTAFSNAPLGIGNVGDLNRHPFSGYIDDVRITKGVARYTANFTPPTEAHPTTEPSGIVTDSLTLNLDIGDNTSYAGTGTTVNNIAGSDTATLTGNILFSSDNEGYLDFDGSDDTMQVANGSSVDIVDAITIEAWINPDAVIGWTSLVYKNNANQPEGYHLGFDPAGNIAGGVRNSGTWITTQPGIAVNVGQWQHFVMSIDTNTNVQKFYKNGDLLYTNSNFTANLNSNTNPLSISGQPITGVEKYNGKLAKTALYSRALTDGEVYQNFNVTKARFGL